MGDRYGGIKKIAYLITGMVHNLEDTLDNFNYIFTKFNDKELESMNGVLELILDNMSEQEKANLPYRKLFEDLYVKTKDNNTMHLNPLLNDPSGILNNLMRTTSISDPLHTFRQYITQPSSEAITNQVHMH
jgi:c-di-AMP phosphodiesterase-like protein